MRKTFAFTLLAVVFLAALCMPAHAAIEDDVNIHLLLQPECSPLQSTCAYSKALYLSVHTTTPFNRINVNIDGVPAIRGRSSFSRGINDFKPLYDGFYRFNEALRFGAPGTYRVVAHLFNALGEKVGKVIENVTVNKVSAGLSKIEANEDDTYTVQYRLYPLYGYTISGTVNVDIKGISRSGVLQLDPVDNGSYLFDITLSQSELTSLSYSYHGTTTIFSFSDNYSFSEDIFYSRRIFILAPEPVILPQPSL